MDTVQVFYKIPERFPPWPDIRRIPKEETSEMHAKLISHPPLGHATVVPAHAKVLQFRVVLEVDAASQKNWEVKLWHDLDGFEKWREDALSPLSEKSKILSVGTTNSESKLLHFTLELRKPIKHANSVVNFTIKFRHESMSDWKWVRDQYGLTDGCLYLQPEEFQKREFSDFIHGTAKDIKIDRERSETPDTLLWLLSAPVKKAEGQTSGFAELKLGIPTNFTRWFAICRLYSPWILPRHGKSKFEVDKDAITVAFLRDDGLSVVALAISGINDTSSYFKHDDDGCVVIHARNDADSDSIATVIVAVAASFDIANASVMYHARKLSMGRQSESGEIPEQLQIQNEQEGVKPNWYEQWYDGFGYCTWNSLGQQLNEKAIFEVLKGLRENDITITNLIIDDNWQDLDNEGQGQGSRGMRDFEANKKGFPNGLKSTVATIRKENPSIAHVAVWHTMLGYWGAISPTGALTKRYRTVQAMNNNGWKWTCIAPEDVGRFYDDFYTFLSSCGVDGVKNDSQNSLDDLQDAPDRRTLIRSNQDAWTIATLRHLGSRAISCGSQCPVIMFHSMIPTSKPRIVVRNSDDFFPQIDSSHAWHIFCNAHNSLFSQHLHILPDWDMFQTNHPWAAYHAAARCISGGPVYITDYPGKHDKNLIKQMTATTPHGETVVLRPQRVAKSSQAYVSYEEPKLLKIDTYNGRAKTGTSIVGVFNVCQFPLSEIASLDEFPGTEEGDYIIRSHVKGKTSEPVKRGDQTACIHLELDVKGYDILSAFPVQKFVARSGPVAVANLGLIDKMSGAAAIVNSQLYVDTAGRVRIWTSLKALGVYGLWIDTLPGRSIDTDLMGVMFGQPIPRHCVKASATDENVLEVDLETAWKEGDFKQTWSNEVAVEIFIN